MKTSKNPNTNICSDIVRRSSGHMSYLDMKRNNLIRSFAQVPNTTDNLFEPVDYGRHVTAMDVDPTGNLLMTGGNSGKIFFHDLLGINTDSGRLCNLTSVINLPLLRFGRVSTRSLSTLQWHPNDPGLFICSANDGVVRVYDTAQKEEVEKFEFNTCIFHHQINKFEPNLVAVAAKSSKVCFVDLRIGRPTQVLLQNHSRFVFGCSWSPSNSHVLATAGDDSVIRLWDIRSYRNCTQINREESGIEKIINGINYTIDGRSIVAISQTNNLHIIDLLTKQQKCRKLGEEYHTHPKIVIPKVVGYLGCNICIAPYSNTLKIYSLEEDKMLNCLHGHFHEIQCFSFNRERIELYSGAKYHNALFWSFSNKLCPSNSSIDSDYTVVRLL